VSVITAVVPCAQPVKNMINNTDTAAALIIFFIRLFLPVKAV
jgi:hypothetical protein